MSGMRVVELTQPGELAQWLLSSGPYVALDFETTGLERGDKIISGAVTGADENDVAFFGPEFLKELQSLPSTSCYVAHNASFEMKMSAWNGVRLHDTHQFIDTLILCHLDDENLSLSLGERVLHYYGDDYKAAFRSKYKKATDAPQDELKYYNALDVHYTLRIFKKLKPNPDLSAHVHLTQKSLVETEIAGVRVDTEYLITKGTELKREIDELLPKMRACAPVEIDILELRQWSKEIAKYKTDKRKALVEKPQFQFDSSKQVAELLYRELGLPEQTNEKTKKVTADEKALLELEGKHPLISLLLRYRELNKVYGTYIEGTLERMHNGRVYPNFNVCGTSTGRISHSNPNLGQLPRSGGIRGIYIPDEGHSFISADYAQLEVCISAHYTRDKALLRIVENGESQHDITAAALGIDRQVAKTVNFASQYGASHFKIARVLGVEPNEGKRAYEKYWATYSGQRDYMEKCKRLVDKGEPIVSILGRHRRFEIKKRMPWDAAYRQAWNALVQGTGADCTSKALYEVDAKLRAKGIGKSLFSVHDEIVIQAKKGSEEEAEKILVDTMVQVGKDLKLTVALKAEGSGPMERWED